MSGRKTQYVAGLFLCALILGGCDSAEQDQETTVAAKVSVLTLEPAALNISENLPGRVAAFRTAEIRAQVGGIVQQRLFEQGADIKAGAALFQIDPAPFKAEVQTSAAALQRAQAVLARARLQAVRLEPLVQAEAVSQQLYDDAVSQRDQAAADVAQAQAVLARKQLDLTFATVKAPIAGRVDQAVTSEGALVATTDSSPMATVQQIDKVYIDVRQSATSLERWRDELGEQLTPGGVTVQVLDSNGKAYGLNAKILFSGISVDPGTGNVLLRIQVDNPTHQLLPGMYVLAKVPRAHHAAALSVPQEAVLRRNGQASVWVVDEHEQAHRVPIEVGELADRRYRISSGLNTGQRVVIEGTERLVEGAPVSASAWLPPAQRSQEQK